MLERLARAFLNAIFVTFAILNAFNNHFGDEIAQRVLRLCQPQLAANILKRFGHSLQSGRFEFCVSQDAVNHSRPPMAPPISTQARREKASHGIRLRAYVIRHKDLPQEMLDS